VAERAGRTTRVVQSEAMVERAVSEANKIENAPLPHDRLSPVCARSEITRRRQHESRPAPAVNDHTNERTPTRPKTQPSEYQRCRRERANTNTTQNPTQRIPAVTTRTRVLRAGCSGVESTAMRGRVVNDNGGPTAASTATRGPTCAH